MTAAKYLTSWFVLMMLVCWPMQSFAHVHLEKSVPDTGSVLTSSPTKVELWFSGKVSGEWSKIQVTDASGKRVDTKKVSNSDDPKHLSVDLEALSAGEHKVLWNVISGDGHRIKGSFSFTLE